MEVREELEDLIELSREKSRISPRSTRRRILFLRENCNQKEKKIQNLKFYSMKKKKKQNIYLEQNQKKKRKLKDRTTLSGEKNY